MTELYVLAELSATQSVAEKLLDKIMNERAALAAARTEEEQWGRLTVR